jgi:hypothetical protein
VVVEQVGARRLRPGDGRQGEVGASNQYPGRIDGLGRPLVEGSKLLRIRMLIANIDGLAWSEGRPER